MKQYWHLQMSVHLNGHHLSDQEVRDILTRRSIIGTGDWEDKLQGKSQAAKFKEDLQPGDYVMVRSGNTPIALVEVTGPNNGMGTDYQNERPIKVLGWYEDVKDLLPSPKKIKASGTLDRLVDEKTLTYTLVSRWHKLTQTHPSMKAHLDLLTSRHQIILQGPPGTGKTYTAKQVAFELIYGETVSLDEPLRRQQMKSLSSSEQFRLVQFHPSYGYEDFVRGISAETDETNGITYTVHNRILGEFATKAQRNLLNSQKDKAALSHEKQISFLMEAFADKVSQEIEKTEKYNLSNKAYISEVHEDSFRYTGDQWQSLHRMPFSQIELAHLLGLKTRKEFTQNREVSGSARQHATYYLAMLKQFNAFVAENHKPKISEEEAQEPQKNFVLIIDEINRANLPAVLGELIYALEYRGEAVDSLYEHPEEGRSITLPPNLYIIGTMNTADRSVGHIDYAIRRRFAFVDMLPDKAVIQEEWGRTLFDQVAELFQKHCAPDFSQEEVQLGHSYFMAESPEELATRLQYEIKPILKEYLKDGVLTTGAAEAIQTLQVHG